MTGDRLDVPDAGKVRLVPVVDTRLQLALTDGVASPRHRVANNLPGTPRYCPMVRRTDAILAYEAQAFHERGRAAGSGGASGRVGGGALRVKFGGARNP